MARRLEDGRNQSTEAEQPKRGGLALAASLFVAGACLAGFAWTNADSTAAGVQQVDFSVRDAAGTRVRLGDLTQSGPAVLIFGASPSDVEAVASVASVDEVAVVVSGDAHVTPEAQASMRGIRLLIDADGSLARTFNVAAERVGARAVLVAADGQVIAADTPAALVQRLTAARAG